MTSRERINAAIRQKQPDRVPVWCLLSLEHILNWGTPDGKIPKTIEDLVKAECNLARRYHFDGSLVYFPATKAGTRIDTFLEKMIYGIPQGDASHIFEKADPESWTTDIMQYQKDDFYSSHLAREILGDDIHLGGWIADGFSRALQWFPRLEDAMMALIDDPPRFKALIAYFDELSISSASAQIEFGGLESIQISSPYAGSSLLSKTMYRQFVLPSVQKLAQAIKPTSGVSYLHTCGFISDRLETMAKTDIDGMECMDPPPLGNVTLAEAKRRVGKNIFLKGNIDSVNILLQGQDSIVDDTIRDTIISGMSGGGYILSTACSVSPLVKPERVQRLQELADQFGQY